MSSCCSMPLGAVTHRPPSQSFTPVGRSATGTAVSADLPTAEEIVAAEHCSSIFAAGGTVGLRRLPTRGTRR